MDNTISENYLNKCWEDFSREQMRLMNDIRTGKAEEDEKRIQRELTLVNGLMISIMRLRNLKKKDSGKL